MAKILSVIIEENFDLVFEDFLLKKQNSLINDHSINFAFV